MEKMLGKLEENRVFEFLGTIINDIFVISRGFNNYLISGKIQKETEKISGLNYGLVGIYFSLKELNTVPLNYVLEMEKLLLLIRGLNRDLSNIDDFKREEILNFINFEIGILESKYEYKFLLRFKDIILHEFKLDHIDVTGDAVEETSMLLNLIMMKK
ncbi:MAG: hypothetical protein PHV23_03205 [Candidatus Gracilibacteria bacterium]|nr:hypothetical protein [Candidatus Gracilibacteria bacterium]